MTLLYDAVIEQTKGNMYIGSSGLRSDFENWYEADSMPAESDWFKRDAFDPDEYAQTCTSVAWRAWQASARLYGITF